MSPFKEMKFGKLRKKFGKNPDVYILFLRTYKNIFTHLNFPFLIKKKKLQRIFFFHLKLFIKQSKPEVVFIYLPIIQKLCYETVQIFCLLLSLPLWTLDLFGNFLKTYSVLYSSLIEINPKILLKIHLKPDPNTTVFFFSLDLPEPDKSFYIDPEFK